MIGRIFLALVCLAGLTGHGAAALATEQERAEIPADDGEIVVIGMRGQADLLSGLNAEAELDEGGIAAYGHDTVGDLLGEVLRQADNTEEGPVVLINGQPSSGINSISDLPTEAVAKIQLLPRDAAARLGERTSRRVVNVVIKSSLRQVTLNGSAAMATAGGAFVAEGELNLLRLNNGDRSSLVMSVRHNSPLFESDRPIRVSLSGLPFDPIGNILPDPSSSAEVDPALSLLAGRIVRVAGIPDGVSLPALGDFVALANHPNLRVPVRNRTLLSDQSTFSLNANLSRQIGEHTNLSLNFRAGHSRAGASTGAASALLQLPETSPFSPFGRDVLIARYIGEPLRNENKATDLNLAAVINTQFGKWRFSAGSSFVLRDLNVLNERRLDTAVYRDGIKAGSINPFAPAKDSHIDASLRDLSKVRSNVGAVFATISGSPWKIPSGPVNAALRIEWKANRVSTDSEGETVNAFNRFHREESSAQLSLNVPVLGGRRTSAIGDVDLELSGTLKKITATGGTSDYAAAINWRPNTAISLRAEINEQQIAPPSNLLTDPVISFDNVRVFDFVRQETVFVRQIMGGNPDLGVETQRTKSFSGTLLPFESPDFSLNAEYARVVNLNAYSSLPPANAEVQAGFSDRFQRDGLGRLTVVDFRPVPFARLGQSRIRWGFNFNRSFKGIATPGPTPAAPAGPASANVLEPGLRINAFGTHEWTLSSTQFVRPGLPVVDILASGASANGSTRHVVQFGGGVAHNGIGLQLNGTMLGPRAISAGTLANPESIRFAALTRIDLRLFANLASLFPKSRLASGARVTIEVDNLLDAKQRVTDRLGQTPDRYQPFLIDPVGRRITLKLRKVF